MARRYHESPTWLLGSILEKLEFYEPTFPGRDITHEKVMSWTFRSFYLHLLEKSLKGAEKKKFSGGAKMLLK